MVLLQQKRYLKRGIEITGEITKGEYHGDMPIIKITEIKKINKPSKDEYVYPPDDSYIPTYNVL